MDDRTAARTNRLGAADQAIAGPKRPSSTRPRGRARKLLVVGTLALLGALAAGGFFYWARSTGAEIHYSSVEVTRGPVVRSVTATGTVNPVLTIIVGSYVSGVIQQLFCDYNTQVKQGQVCAKIDPRPYQTIVDQDQANLAVEKAQLEKDQANLAYAQLNYERNSRLVQTNAVSKDAADNAKNVYDQAQAQITFDQATIQQREAELKAAQINLDYTNIVSPVDGTVVSRNVTQGQTVAASFQTPTLFLIATDLTTMQVDTNVSESDIGNIKEGNKATFTVDAFPKRTFAGQVTQLRQSPQTVQNVVTYDVVVGVDNSDMALMPGMTAATRIIVDSREDVTRVPNQALRYRPSGLNAGQVPALPEGQGRVWVLRQGQPVMVEVTIGLDDDSFTEITGSGLSTDDHVITGEQGGATGGASSLPRFRL